MEFVRCVGHGVKLHVLLAQWAATTVVLKTSEPVSNYSIVARHLLWDTHRNRIISKPEFVREVSVCPSLECRVSP